MMNIGFTGPDLNARSSLEDILRLDLRANGGIPEATSLPESESGYSATQEASGRESEDEIGRSLYALQMFDAPLIPSAVRLPSSDNLPMVQQPERKRRKEENKCPRFLYKDIIQNASKALDHIANGNLQAVSRHDRSSIIYYDYLCDESVYSQPIEDARELPSLGDRTDVRHRLILVEDLSQSTIKILATRFGINPEFFEEHLLNSGYSGANFNQPLSKTWRTGSLRKSYVCMKWFRPVWRTPTYFSSRDMPDLLRDRTEHFTRSGKLTTRVETNIFRLEWDLWTDPAKTIRVSRECGWEEKVSIWKGSLPDQDLIVLLDPLPWISEQQGLIKKEPPHQPERSQETSRPLPDAGDDGNLVEGGAIFSRTNEDDLSRRTKKNGSTNPFKRREKPKYVDKDPVRRCIIEQMAPRQEMAVNLDQIFRNEEPTLEFLASLTRTRSTRDELCDALKPGAGHISLAFPLLQIICRDMFTLLKQLCQTLDEIDIEITDDTRMEDRLYLWRQIISRAQRELPEFTASIKPLVAFVANIGPSGAHEDGPENVSNGILDLKTLLEEIQRVLERLRVTSVSLTSNMALLDSHRSIAEAHAVTRLTELAFIFIPLSFAATVFGMQIEPFSNPVPASYFFAVAAVATGFSYTMRIVMRSQWLTQMKIDMKADIRKYAEKNGISVKPRSLSGDQYDLDSDSVA
ncbi:Mg2+ transporter protein CorA-like/Zinc transport protein ZntB [Penicillium nucicola]|uniref:Mg2+ transporter protein CorA-like/Zinc transport protein ZntB n=1 Tax=Penicillium nucicola TaxID=1850975 RepID=UPI0025453550|nr:Mg2+ transporter protein CorA-like/Zinc transport protein ZntB [Penicillium nucicola]KAJ5776172.1 Mg2+ transporter protein CorA-like/Zinc transport protein ZntB [Penicillium nucicola]